jgi:hypothetical protein
VDIIPLEDKASQYKTIESTLCELSLVMNKNMAAEAITESGRRL